DSLSVEQRAMKSKLFYTDNLPLPRPTLSADVEITIFSMFSHTLFYLLASEEEFQSSLEHVKDICGNVDSYLQEEFVKNPSLDNLKLVKTSNQTYAHLNWPNSSHPLELLNSTFYSGL